MFVEHGADAATYHGCLAPHASLRAYVVKDGRGPPPTKAEVTSMSGTAKGDSPSVIWLVSLYPQHHTDPSTTAQPWLRPIPTHCGRSRGS